MNSVVGVNSKVPKVFDCTLRDGGYYNNWDFPLEVVNSYLASLRELEIYGVELGFRSNLKGSHRGPFAYTTDATIETLNLPENYLYAVMINASELPENTQGISQFVNQLFADSQKSRVQLVRIAAHYFEVPKSLIAMEALKSKGYLVAINLMGINLGDSEKLLESLDLKALKQICEVLYLADSNGRLIPEEYSKLVDMFGSGLQIPVGVHTHDNKGLAMANSLAAVSKGATWVDATVTGMGRGPGNTKLENLILELNSTISASPRKMGKLLNVIEGYFGPEQRRLNWGTNSFYHIAAHQNVHPLRVQELLGNSEVTPEQLLEFLSPEQGIKTLRIKEPSLTEQKEGLTWLDSQLKKQRILVLANNTVLKKYGNAINQFISKFDPLVISINGSGLDSIRKIDLIVASFETRVLDSFNLAQKNKIPFLSPFKIVYEDDTSPEIQQICYPLEISETDFEVSDSRIVLNSDEAITYLLSILMSRKSSQIWLAGVNGNSNNLFTHAKLLSYFSKLSKIYNLENIVSLTPTTLPLREESIFELM